MGALWLIGYEDEPERSAEICVCEIFGRDVGAETTVVGLGLHPFGDPAIVDDFSRLDLPLDAREPHVYAAEWTPDGVAFLVDGEAVKTVDQSPGYPMQLMLNIYEFPPAGTDGPPRPIRRSSSSTPFAATASRAEAPDGGAPGNREAPPSSCGTVRPPRWRLRPRTAPASRRRAAPRC